MSAVKIPHGHILVIYDVFYRYTILRLSNSSNSEDFLIILCSSKMKRIKKDINNLYSFFKNPADNTSSKYIAITRITFWFSVKTAQTTNPGSLFKCYLWRFPSLRQTPQQLSRSNVGNQLISSGKLCKRSPEVSLKWNLSGAVIQLSERSHRILLKFLSSRGFTLIIVGGLWRCRNPELWASRES